MSGPELRVGFGFGDLPAPFQNTPGAPQSRALPPASIGLTAAVGGLTASVAESGTGIPVGFWGARHDRTHYDGGQSDMEAINTIHGATAMQASGDNPNARTSWMTAAEAKSMSLSLRITQGWGSYSSGGAPFDVAQWKADVDTWKSDAEGAGIYDDYLAWIANGTWWGVMMGDDLGLADNQPSATDWEGMAQYVKDTISSDLVLWARPGTIGEIPSAAYGALDMAMLQINTRSKTTQQDVIDWTDIELAGTDARSLTTCFSINCETGSESDIISPRGAAKPYDFMMITGDSELDRTWGYWLTLPETGGIWSWEYDSGPQTAAMIPIDPAGYPPQDCSPDRSFAAWFDGATGCSASSGNIAARIAVHVASAAEHIAVDLQDG